MKKELENLFLQSAEANRLDNEVRNYVKGKINEQMQMGITEDSANAITELLDDLKSINEIATEEAIKQRRAEDMQYYEKEDILKELWNKPELRDSLEFAMKYHIRRINNGLPFNALEDEMINVHLLTPLFKCKFPHNFCYVLAELVKISFERKTKPIVLDNPKELGELPKAIQPLIKELTDSLKT